jgi:hypothetical protein
MALMDASRFAAAVSYLPKAINADAILANDAEYPG